MSLIPELTGRLGDSTVELRAISEWDIPEILIAHQDDPELYRALGLAKPPSGAQLGSEVETSRADAQAGTRVALTIVEPGHNDCRGRVEVDAIDWQARAAQLSVWVAPGFRGRGYARSALALTAAWLERIGITELTQRAVIDS